MIFKSNYYYYIQLLLLCFLLSSCQTPKYSKVTNITDTSDFLPEVQYTISENFNPKKLSCIAIGKITDASEESDYKSLDKVLLIRHAIYGHLSPKNYQDVELHKVASVMNSSSDHNVILDSLNCDALLEGTITEFRNNFYVAFSSTNVGLSLSLKDKNNKVLWKASHTAVSRAGSIPFSPIGLATGLFSASSNTEDEVAFQMIDTVVRRLLKTLPETKDVAIKDQLKFAVIPNSKSSQVLVKINEKKDETPEVLFAQGYYGKAIDKINVLLKSKPNDHKVLFLKGRSQLMLNQFKSASSTFLDALAIESKSDYFNGLGFAYSKLKQIDMSLAAYNKSISLDNKNSYAYFHSGLLLENLGTFKKASEYFYSSGTSAILKNDFTRANNAKDALKRLSKSDFSVKERSDKLIKLIKDFTEDKDKDFKLLKVKTSGD